MVDQQDNDVSTVFVGNVDGKVTEEILYELFLQAGPVKSVCIPTDYRTGRKQRYGFVTFKHKVSVNYCIKMLNGIKLFNCALNLDVKQKNKSNAPADVQINQSYNGEHSMPRMHNTEQFRPVFPHHYITAGLNGQDAYRSGVPFHDSILVTPHMDRESRYSHGRNSPYAYTNSSRETYVNDFNGSFCDNSSFNDSPHNGSSNKMRRVQSYHSSNDRYSHREERKRVDYNHHRRSVDGHRSSVDGHRSSVDGHHSSVDGHRSIRRQHSNRPESRLHPYRRR